MCYQTRLSDVLSTEPSVLDILSTVHYGLGLRDGFTGVWLDTVHDTRL